MALWRESRKAMTDQMIDLNEIRRCVASLRKMGLEIDGFTCSPETVAELNSAGLTAAVVIRQGDTRWLERTLEDGEMGRGIGTQYGITLAGIRVTQKV